MRNFCPRIYRQTGLVEWLCEVNITEEQTADYIERLAKALQMTLVEPPVTSLAEDFGWAGYAHWVGDKGLPPLHRTPASTNGWGRLVESGVHFYAWDIGTGPPAPWAFASVEAYTCSSFDIRDAVALTIECFPIPAGDDGKLLIDCLDIQHGEVAAQPGWRSPRAVR